MEYKLNEIVSKIIMIREFEKKIQEVYHLDIIQSPVHLSIGQELTSVLISQNTESRDSNRQLQVTCNIGSTKR